MNISTLNNYMNISALLPRPISPVSGISNTSIFSNYTNYSTYSNLMTGLIDYNAVSALRVREGADNFFDVTLEIMNGFNGSDSRSVFSSNEDAVGIINSNGGYNYEYEVGVEQIATAQENRSSLLSTDSQSEISEGSYDFEVSSGGENFSFGITVNNEDTNASVLDRIASAINDGSNNFNASVEETDDRMYLSIRGNETGESNAFQISGNIADELGFSNIYSGAQNALFTLNGNRYEQESNTVSLYGGSVEAELRAETTGTVNIDFGIDEENLNNGINNFVNAYNTLISRVNSGGYDSQSVDNLVSGIKQNLFSLNNIGITINTNNTLSVDEDILSIAINQDKNGVSDIFAGSYGLASMGNFAAISLRGESYNFGGGINLPTYNNTGNQINSYLAGSLFDYYL